jgi:hypothetical protein
MRRPFVSFYSNLRPESNRITKVLNAIIVAGDQEHIADAAKESDQSKFSATVRFGERLNQDIALTTSACIAMDNCVSFHASKSPMSNDNSITKQISTSNMDYRKSQFHKPTLPESQGIPDSSESDSPTWSKGGIVSVRAEANSLPPLLVGGLRTSSVLERIIGQQHFEPTQHMLQVCRRFYLINFDSESDPPPFTGPKFCDLTVEADALQSPGSTTSFFAPPSFPAILRFCDSLERTLDADPSRLIALRLPPRDLAALAAGVFLAGTYMILRIGLSPDEVAPRFTSLAPLLRPPSFPEPPCAPATAPPTPDASRHCTHEDCWAGLWKAHRLGWLAPNAVGAGGGGPDLSRDDGDEADSPFRPDIQVLVPGRLVVFQGPKGLLDGLPWRDVMSGDGRPVGREFAPAGLVPALRRVGVQAVVRLSAAEYAADAFPAAGLGFADLYIPEGGTPSPAVAAKFLRILDAVPGAVAVHGGSCLGRAGALAALFAMRWHSFSAREAAGWLCAVRPGSVGPEQLAYLVSREAVLRRVAAATAGNAEARAGSASPSSSIELMLGRRSAGPHGEQGPLFPLRRRSLVSLAFPAAEPAFSDGDGAAAGFRVARLIAVAMAEVDSRLQALEPRDSGGGNDCSQPGSPDCSLGVRVGASTHFWSKCLPQMPRRSGSQSAAPDRRRSAGGLSTCSSCPSLTALVERGEEAVEAAVRGIHAGEEEVGAMQRASLRFCADLLQLPAA